MPELHRLASPARAAIALLLVTGCASGAQTRVAAPATPAPGPVVASVGTGGGGNATAEPGASTAIPEQLMIEGWITVGVDDVQLAAADIRKRVEAAGGRVTNEQLSGASKSWTGTLDLRMPPGEVDGFVGWVGSLGEIRDKRVQGTDVSRQLFDQKIQLKNLTLTLQRLRALLDREGLEMKDVLAIETEMTRLRGEIEKIEGEQRWLEDRVAFATMHISLQRREGAVLGPEAKLYPGARGAMLTLFNPGTRSRNRLGAGLVIHTITPGGKDKAEGRATLELDIFPAKDDEKSAVLATGGGSIYSDFLGRGKNRFFNPYLGLRVGYGYLDGSKFAFAGTAGVELFKDKYFLVDINTRMTGLLGKSFDTALVTGGSVVFAF